MKKSTAAVWPLAVILALPLLFLSCKKTITYPGEGNSKEANENILADGGV